MKKIPLSQGKFALVDDDDYDFIMQWKWCFNTGYAVRSQHICMVGKKDKSKMILMHRVVNKTPKGMETDHIDLDRLNNQKKNLRNATRRQNTRNIKKFINGTSKFKGVCWKKREKKWQVRIRTGKKRVHLGLFTSESDAARAYNVAALKFHGEFAHLNEVS